MALTAWDKFCDGLGYRLIRWGFQLRKVTGTYPIIKPIDPSNVEVLGDLEFQASVREVADLTVLDTGRLANLWKLCRMTDPAGGILEIGSYRGGGALHLSNTNPARRMVICDSFKSFETVDPKLDKSFHQQMFRDTSRQHMENLFHSHGRNFEIVEGFFPASAAGKKLGPISFVHLDVDIYKASIESLTYLQTSGILMEKALVVLDDYDRNAQGVNQAVAEFTAAHRRWLAVPLFPSQCLLVPETWFPSGRRS